MLEGLERLEYRGYDSAGIAVLNDNNLTVCKTTERIKNLTEKTNGGKDIHGTTGIGHTRWATHGAPSDKNAHPHTSSNGKFAVVHNGIIENYVALREELKADGAEFKSETDTEVIPQLLARCYTGDFFEAVAKTVKRLEGSYALGIICTDYPDTLIAVRKFSPLILGLSDDANYIASDVTAIVSHTKDIMYIEDGEIAVLTPCGVKLYDGDKNELHRDHAVISWDVSAAEKGGYPHFMLKEIFEQPEAVRKTVSPRVREGRVVLDDLRLTKEYIQGVSRIFIVACGSSYHVGMVSKYNWERLLRRPVEVCLASEFRYCDPLVDDHSLVIFISQSGETLDTMAALRETKRRGGRTLAVVNVVGSSIAREADDVLYTWAGPEIAVATTKAYSTQLVLMDLIALYLGDLLGTIEKTEYDTILHELEVLPEKLERVLTSIEDVKYFASRYFNHDSIFFIGRNLDYAMGLEGSLKLKEISYIHSEAYASGELKHGTISLIEPGTLVVALGTYEPLFDKAMSNVVEVKARGAEVLALATEPFKEKMAHTADSVIAVPETHPVVQPSLGVVPLQLFAYYVALQRGCDIDKPRNLAKSVTVE